MRRVKRGSISSGMLMCGGGVCSILLLPLVARCIETIDVRIWSLFVFMYVQVTVCGSVEMLLCTGHVEDSGFWVLGCWRSLLLVCVCDVMDVVFSVCIVMRGAAGACIWEVWVFRYTDVVSLCLVCILCQSSMLHYAWTAVC